MMVMVILPSNLATHNARQKKLLDAHTPPLVNTSDPTSDLSDSYRQVELT